MCCTCTAGLHSTYFTGKIILFIRYYLLHLRCMSAFHFLLPAIFHSPSVIDRHLLSSIYCTCTAFRFLCDPSTKTGVQQFMCSWGFWHFFMVTSTQDVKPQGSEVIQFFLRAMVLLNHHLKLSIRRKWIPQRSKDILIPVKVKISLTHGQLSLTHRMYYKSQGSGDILSLMRNRMLITFILGVSYAGHTHHKFEEHSDVRAKQKIAHHHSWCRLRRTFKLQGSKGILMFECNGILPKHDWEFSCILVSRALDLSQYDIFKLDTFPHDAESAVFANNYVNDTKIWLDPSVFTQSD